MEMPESQKFGILRTLMMYEERPHVRAVYGMASYYKESFNSTIKKTREEWDTVPLEKGGVAWRQASQHRPLIGSASDFSDKKFKGKADTRNNSSKGTNGMHNNMPLTQEHQMELGKGESKPTPGNPKGYSKRQITVLNFFRDRDSKNRIRNSNDDGNFSNWGGETNSFRNNENVEYKKGMAFNMFKPSDRESITPSKDPTVDEIFNSTLMRGARKDIIRIGEIEPNRGDRT